MSVYVFVVGTTPLSRIHWTNVITVHFQIALFCLSAMVSKWILLEIICILMDFGLAVFWSLFMLMHSFGAKK